MEKNMIHAHYLINEILQITLRQTKQNIYYKYEVEIKNELTKIYDFSYIIVFPNISLIKEGASNE